jgi:hypothetical protein
MAKVKQPLKTKFANHELVTLALYLLGGGTKPVDLEEIAVRANQLAPGRFTWKHYPEQINIKNVDAFLWDARKAKNGSYVVNAKRDEWILTTEGLRFAREHVSELEGADLSRKALSAKERNWIRRERERMLASEAYVRFAAGNSDRISAQEAEAFFRVDAYVTGKARAAKLLRAQNVFGEDPELGPLIRLLVPKIPQGE